MGEDIAPKETLRKALAREAGSTRLWLTGFFRRRIRNDHEVEDLVQDVFTRVAARDSEETINHLGGYILQTAKSVIADRARRRTARFSAFHVALDSDRFGEDDLDPEQILSGKEELRAALAILLSLPERTRTVFLLKRLEGYKYAEIARHLGISVSAVEKHMVRAIRHLSAEMEKRNGA